MKKQTIKSIIKQTLIIGSLTLLLTSCSSNNEIELQGAGATFPYPLYSKMFTEYFRQNNVKINYQSVGSGAGVRQLKNKTVDFGASDAFMKTKDLNYENNTILHIPTCLGAVSLSYNLPGITDLKLTSDIIADIFLGKIKKWNVPSIQAINPDKKLPDLNILSVHRSDGSGTTFIFTDYLTKVNKGWETEVGRGKAVNWPDGVGGKGNAGVAGTIAQTPGSIGYVSNIYATQNKMPVASIKNKSGNYISPSIEAVSKAANTTIPTDTRASITNTNAKDGYPISGFTWILAFQDQSINNRTKEQALATQKMLTWMITQGQQYTQPLQYAPLPESVVSKARTIINSMTYQGQVL